MTKHGERRRIILGAGRRIVLYDWANRAEPRFRNLVCLDGAGQVVWRADLPDASLPDCFTRIESDDGAIVAYTDRGARLRLSPGTGRPLG